MFKDKPPHGEKDVINDLVFSIVKEQKAKRRWGIFFKLLFIAYIVFITATFFVNKKESMVSVPHTAEIDVSGVIAAGTETSADHVIQGLHNAFKNSQVKGVILRINSPGGSPVQSEEIYNEVRRLEKNTPKKKCMQCVRMHVLQVLTMSHQQRMKFMHNLQVLLVLLV
ncbi:ATP-dependent Clp protease proteolytic subunit [Piscirickettsia salmonis]|uniref:ATP-dependent Clp protease proteolytic subunit n=1 Tax=Piscirickettsia salmonis TaxID=1238 RepID=UPI0002EB1840|nr:ATP-dependent Clp protease proteolytic subunit [Piscirickettsia salmonis]